MSSIYSLLLCELALHVQMFNDHAGVCADEAVEEVRVYFTGLSRGILERQNSSLGTRCSYCTGVRG